MKKLGYGFAFLLAAAATLWPSGITQSAYNLVENAGSALTRRTTLNMTGAGVSCADNSGSNRTDCTVSGGGGGGGTNTQTGDYTLVSGDSGKLVIMNCSGACTVTLYGTPSSTFYGSIVSIGSTVAAVSLNSLNFNGASTVPVLISYQPLQFWSDSSNYFGLAPPVAGSNVTLTPATYKLTYASSGGGGGSFSAIPPYYSDGTHQYVAATGYQATLPSGSPTWINSVTPTVTAGANGDVQFSGTGTYWAELAGTTSVEAEFALAGAQTSTSSDTEAFIWIYDSTNHFIFTWEAAECHNGASSNVPCLIVNKFTYSGSGNPVYSSTPSKFYSVWGPVAHLRIAKSGSTATFSISLDGGATFTALTTQSVGTLSDGGYGGAGNSATMVGVVYSLVVI